MANATACPRDPGVDRPPVGPTRPIRPSAAGRRGAPAAVLLSLLLLPLMLIAAGPSAAQTPTARSDARDAVVAEYDPRMGVRLVSPDRAVEVTVPFGAAAEPATFSQEALSRPAPVGALRFARAFRLLASTIAGNRPLTTFAKPVRIRVGYDDADLAAVGATPADLRLMYRGAEGAWILVPSTVDPATRTVSAAVDHFTDFGLGVSAVEDSFDRADSSTLLGAASGGQSWRTDGSSWGICGQAACSFGPTESGNYVRLDAGLSTQRVSTTVRARPADAVGPAGILLAMTPDWNTNLLWVGLSPSGRVEVWTLSAGVWSSGAVASADTGLSATAARTLAAGVDTSLLVPQLTVYVDGASVLGGVTVPTVPALGTWAGLYTETNEPADRWPVYDAFAVRAGP